MDQAVGMGCNVRLTGVMDRFNWRLQYERDAPLDRSGIKQAYADVSKIFEIDGGSAGRINQLNRCDGSIPPVDKSGTFLA